MEPRTARLIREYSTAAPLPANEAERLASLHALHVLDTLPEEAFDDITRLAAAICGTPTALVSFIDADRQWFKSRVGMTASETPRDVAFCAHALLDDVPLVVPDATQDERFAANPLVTGETAIRFYAGAQIVSPDGLKLGTVCVIDTKPRELTAGQKRNLIALSRQVTAQLRLQQQVGRQQEIEASLRQSENRFRAFMDRSPAVAFIKDERRRFVYVNRPLLEHFGTPAEHWLGRTDADLWPKEVSDKLDAVDQAVLDAGRTQCIEEMVPTADGAECFWRSYKFPFEEDGRRFLAGMAINVTAEKRAADSVRASEERFRELFDSMQEMAQWVAADGRLLLTNRAWRERLGYGEADARDLHFEQLVPVAGAMRFVTTFRRALLGEPGRDVPGRLTAKSGAIVEVEADFFPQAGGGLRAVFRDVTDRNGAERRLLQYQQELEGVNARLRHLSVTDPLTGIANRAAFQERLDGDYARCLKGSRPLSLLMVDIDHFKLFNDTHGHQVGDRVLRTVAETLQRTARGTDFLARYGGEEFVVILPDAEYAGAMAIAERFRKAVAAIDCPERAITVSIGAATRAADTASAEALLKEADAALYAAKRAGRNRSAHGSGTFAAVAVGR